MKTPNKKAETTLRNGLITFCKIQFLLAALLMGQTILYDTSKLITPETVLDRWYVISGLLVVNSVIWYAVKSKAGHILMYKSLLGLMILADIAVSCYFVYEGRGMASKAVLLFAVPIIISGLLASRSALFAVTTLSIAAYSLTAVSYFVINFNEGYKVELYGEVGFYSLLMLILAGLLAKLLETHD